MMCVIFICVCLELQVSPISQRMMLNPFAYGMCSPSREPLTLGQTKFKPFLPLSVLLAPCAAHEDYLTYFKDMQAAGWTTASQWCPWCTTTWATCDNSCCGRQRGFGEEFWNCARLSSTMGPCRWGSQEAILRLLLSNTSYSEMRGISEELGPIFGQVGPSHCRAVVYSKIWSYHDRNGPFLLSVWTCRCKQAKEVLSATLLLAGFSSRTERPHSQPITVKFGSLVCEN